MTLKQIDYVPITKLSRGYAGHMIEQMKKNDSVVYIMKNNQPLAVVLPVETFNKMSQYHTAERLKHIDTCERLGGSLHSFSDSSMIEGERDFYRKAMTKR